MTYSKSNDSTSIKNLGIYHHGKFPKFASNLTDEYLPPHLKFFTLITPGNPQHLESPTVIPITCPVVHEHI